MKISWGALGSICALIAVIFSILTYLWQQGTIRGAEKQTASQLAATVAAHDKRLTEAEGHEARQDVQIAGVAADVRDMHDAYFGKGSSHLK